MAKFDDKQVDQTIGSTIIHSPAGTTPQHGADAPNVSPVVAAYSAGGQITPIKTTVSGVRIANPA